MMLKGRLGHSSALAFVLPVVETSLDSNFLMFVLRVEKTAALCQKKSTRTGSIVTCHEYGELIQ